MNPRRATVLVCLVAFLIWTGQTYVWNPFFLTGYTYYPFVIFLAAGVLGKLLPHRKRPEKQDLEHTIQELNTVTGQEFHGACFCKCGKILQSDAHTYHLNQIQLVCPSCGTLNLYDPSDARPIESRKLKPQTISDLLPPPPLESLRDDDEA